MKAIRIHRYGEPDVLVYEDAPVPKIGAGQVLVRVHAAGLNPVDYKTRAGGGVAPAVDSDPFPLILGWDIAGMVSDDGGNGQFPEGTSVYGMVGFPDVGAAYAEYALADVSAIATMPRNLDFVAAASLPLAVLTAWQALFDAGDLQAGQRILVHAAAGGVGHLAVQLARWRGAYVIGTASGANIAYLREIGVDEAIDYTTQSFETTAEPVDIVFDTVGGDTLTRSFDMVKPGGKLISIVEQPDAGRAAAKNIDARQIYVAQNGAQMAQITPLVEQGHLKPSVYRTFPLAEVAEAHRLLQTRHVRGKVVLTVAP